MSPAPALRCRGREGKRAKGEERIRSLSFFFARRAFFLFRRSPLPSRRRPNKEKKKAIEKPSRSPRSGPLLSKQRHEDRVRAPCSSFSWREDARERGKRAGTEKAGWKTFFFFFLSFRTTGVVHRLGATRCPHQIENLSLSLPHSPRARARPCRRWERSDR